MERIIVRAIKGGIILRDALYWPKRKCDELASQVERALRSCLRTGYPGTSIETIPKHKRLAISITPPGLREYALGVTPASVVFGVSYPDIDDEHAIPVIITDVYRAVLGALDRNEDVIGEGLEIEYLIPCPSRDDAQNYLTDAFLSTAAHPRLADGVLSDASIVLSINEKDHVRTTLTAQLVSGGEPPNKTSYAGVAIDRRKNTSIPLSQVGDWTKAMIPYLRAKEPAVLCLDLPSPSRPN